MESRNGAERVGASPKTFFCFIFICDAGAERISSRHKKEWGKISISSCGTGFRSTPFDSERGDTFSLFSLSSDVSGGRVREQERYGGLGYCEISTRAKTSLRRKAFQFCRQTSCACPLMSPFFFSTSPTAQLLARTWSSSLDVMLGGFYLLIGRKMTMGGFFWQRKHTPLASNMFIPLFLIPPRFFFVLSHFFLQRDNTCSETIGEHVLCVVGLAWWRE